MESQPIPNTKPTVVVFDALIYFNTGKNIIWKEKDEICGWQQACFWSISWYTWVYMRESL